MAYDENGELVDPTRGEYVMDETEEGAIAQAEALAEDQGLSLHGYHVVGTE